MLCMYMIRGTFGSGALPREDDSLGKWIWEREEDAVDLWDAMKISWKPNSPFVNLTGPGARVMSVLRDRGPKWKKKKVTDG